MRRDASARKQRKQHIETERMKVENSKMVSVNYKLTVDGKVADQSREGSPLQFVCGAGMLLPKFEGAIMGLEPGEKVSFTLKPKDGYGEIIAEAIVDLPKNIFVIDGKPAEEMLFVGNQIPMSDAQGNRLTGRVMEGGSDTVKMDFTLFSEATVWQVSKPTMPFRMSLRCRL